MASPLLAIASAATASDVPLSAREALSGISGISSIVAWLFLLLPQLWENYANQHADGISLAFLLIWFAGDVANLAGALWGGLLPTVVAIGVYFCFIDAALVTQTCYYRVRNARTKEREERGQSAAATAAAADGRRRMRVGRDGERAPLLQRSISGNGDGTTAGDLPYTRRRSSAASKHQQRPALPEMAEQSPDASARAWARNLLAVLGALALGVAAWAVLWRLGWWVPQPEEGGNGSGDVGHDDGGKATVGAEILGYISGILYLGARVPQIWKNWREKSCDGLSLLFFMLSTLGNATFGLQILFHSVEVNYFLKNLPWLIGSLGTIVEDVIIFVQFRMYKTRGSEMEGLEEESIEES